MAIDWLNFTPWTSVAGGILLGIASAGFILISGRVLGISGILGGLLTHKRADMGWRIAFLVGMVCAPLAYGFLAPENMVIVPRIDADFATIVAAGFLVGIGTRFGSGCTSGHGVCGLSRLSPRSLVATLAFMGTGFATVFVARHVF